MEIKDVKNEIRSVKNHTKNAPNPDTTAHIVPPMNVKAAPAQSNAPPAIHPRSYQLQVPSSWIPGNSIYESVVASSNERVSVPVPPGSLHIATATSLVASASYQRLSWAVPDLAGGGVRLRLLQFM